MFDADADRQGRQRHDRQARALDQAAETEPDVLKHTHRTPALATGWLTPTWTLSDSNRRAKYYRLTKAGTRPLEEETAQWNRIAMAMASALNA